MISQSLPQTEIEVQTPQSNTGSTCPDRTLETSIDFLQGTVKFLTVEEFEKFNRFLFNAASQELVLNPDKSFHSGITWRSSGSTLQGSKVGYNISEDGKVHAWYSLPGSFFHELDGYIQWVILSVMKIQDGFKATRIDCKVRDFTRTVTPQQAMDYAKKGHITGVKTCEIASKFGVDNPDKEETTAYFGSRKSEKFLRVYDAMPVHNINAIDWELQCRDEKAEAVYNEFVNLPVTGPTDADMIANFIGAVVFGAVDFVDEPKSFRDLHNIRVSRCHRMKWYQALVDMAGGTIKICCGREPTTIPKKIAWLQKQVMPTISALAHGFGFEVFTACLHEAMKLAANRFSAIHEYIINLCQNYQLTSL